MNTVVSSMHNACCCDVYGMLAAWFVVVGGFCSIQWSSIGCSHDVIVIINSAGGRRTLVITIVTLHQSLSIHCIDVPPLLHLQKIVAIPVTKTVFKEEVHETVKYNYVQAPAPVSAPMPTPCPVSCSPETKKKLGQDLKQLTVAAEVGVMQEWSVMLLR